LYLHWEDNFTCTAAITKGEDLSSLHDFRSGCGWEAYIADGRKGMGAAHHSCRIFKSQGMRALIPTSSKQYTQR